jgi:hypothetical protein
MRSLPSTLAVALACAAFGTAAWAQDKSAAPASPSADSTQVVPSKDQLTPQNPSSAGMDDNAQRQHDRQQGATGQGTGGAAPAQQGAQTTASGAQGAQAGSQELAYDYASMDKNNDHLISPEEMEAQLNAGRSTPMSASGTSQQAAPAASGTPR